MIEENILNKISKNFKKMEKLRDQYLKVQSKGKKIQNHMIFL